MMSRLTLFALAAMCAVISSCSGPGPVKTSPPAKKLVATESFSWGDGFVLKKFIYPDGVYRPHKEDVNGWYYAAPSQLTVKDFPLTYKKQGGIYWKRGQQLPTHVYMAQPVGGSYTTFKKKNIPLGR